MVYSDGLITRTTHIGLISDSARDSLLGCGAVHPIDLKYDETSREAAQIVSLEVVGTLSILPEH